MNRQSLARLLPLVRGAALSFAAWLTLVLPRAGQAQSLPIEKIKLPPGFAIELLARVPNARQMAYSPANILYVGSMREGKGTPCRSTPITSRASCTSSPTG